MIDDLDMAGLLGQAPPSADSGFRIEVFALMAARARARAARRRALTYIVVSTAIGLSFRAADAAGLGFEDLQPLFIAAGAVGVAYLFAALTIRGPSAVLASSRAVLRACG